MTIRNSIALAAVATVLAVPSMAQAHAGHHTTVTKKKKARPAPAAEAAEAGLTTAEQLQLAQQQLAMMQAQLNDMQAKIAAAPAKTDVADAAKAAAAAQAAAVKAQAAADKANTSAASTAKTVGTMSWAAKTKLSGRMYYNVSSITAENTAGTSVEKDGGIQIKRFYIGLDHQLDKTFSANITLDVDNLLRSTSGATDVAIFVKKAYVQAKFSPALTIRAGAADMAWVPYEESLQGFRHIEKTSTDYLGLGTSADWGVHALGSFSDGLISYQISAVNGAGYRTASLTQTIDIEGRVSLSYKGFNVGVGGYTGRLGANVQNTTTYKNGDRFNVIAAYKGKLGKADFTVGGEYIYAKNFTTTLIKSATSNDSTEAYSLFASVSPAPKWTVFGRYDFMKASKDLNPAQHLNFYNVGLQFSPAKIFDLALVYKRDQGTASLVKGNLVSGQASRDEVGIYGQFRF
ncbi:hypothetical protein GTZ99_01230 [Novosphingobium sp. FSY-8]|uniref:Porin n=1 Tax=Novosphingobium ovatum TaxID=1908523 RepID=A0ABW9X9J1_9SPHN|nr:hypothetical protein [Novosphingobium ovatum]NBC35177.1 hypothetical protein [Novosphingobium ovatum]